jgi:hypothetical protein|tara:strand:- start:1863 stop:2252 length:390 start_codon:yes stop_codon:yes gene_type:complete
MAIASFTAGEAITAGQAVYVDSVGKLFKASGGSQTTASVAGIAVDTGSAGTLLRVNVDAPYYGYDNLVPGDKHFLSIVNSGQITTYSGWLEEFDTYADVAYLQYVGRAIVTSGIEIELSSPVQINYPIS